MRSLRSLALLTIASTLVAACGDDSTEFVPTAALRVVNAWSSTSGTVDLVSNGATLTTGISYGTSVGCILVPVRNGGNTFTFSSGTAGITNTTQTLMSGGNYTLLLIGTGTTRTATVIDNNAAAPSAGNVGVRFVNATGAAGNVYATSSTTTSLNGQAVLTGGSNVTAGGSTPFLSTANANTRFWLTDLDGNAIADTGSTALTYPSGGNTTLIFLPRANASGNSFVQANPCA